MPTLATIQDHPSRTDHHGYAYQFTPKHHGADSGAAQWLPELTLDEEFAIFNIADEHDLIDERGWLYGIRRVGDEVVELGTHEKQVAVFPAARLGIPWHGYPFWPESKMAAGNRRGEKMRPDSDVLARMVAVGLLTAQGRKRLLKGKHA